MIKSLNKLNKKFLLVNTLFVSLLAWHFLLPPTASPAPALLKKIIISYNLKTLQKSLVEETYRGEAGILWIRPEEGRSLGLNVYVDQDYLDSRKLLKRATEALEKAEGALTTRRREKVPGEHARNVATYFLMYKKSVESGREKAMTYRSRLHPKVDDRLNESKSAKVMDLLLEKCLKKTGNKLRDALGCFYNISQGEGENDQTLTPENILFVNEIFRQFTKEAPAKALDIFDLDRAGRQRDKLPGYDWREGVEKKGTPFIPVLEAIFKKLGNRIYKVDPLLFMALMRRESTFNPLAVSPAGAAGLTQIMPQTAKKLGMKNIYQPSYFRRAGNFLREERKTKKEALSVLSQINEDNKATVSRRARSLMQKSLNLGKSGRRLLSRYKRELLQARSDERLHPAKAIEFGLKHFAHLMKKQGGDISLALASYNAGSHRVKEFQGIPPYTETVYFRNRVLNYYQGYLRKAQGAERPLPPP